MFPVFDIFVSIILGIVEALTEFLPISSTGHLILVNQFLNFSQNIDEQFTYTFDVVIQLGAILAVVVYFFKRFNNIELWKKIIYAVIPALIIGFLLSDIIEDLLFNPYIVAVALIIGGIIILVIESKKNIDKIDQVEKINYKKALLIGLIQCLAMIPGTSRSAATIIGGRLLGASRLAAAEFSFFLAIPTMIAASGYSLLKSSSSFTSTEYIILAVGFIVSFLGALLVIKFFLQYITKHDFKIFGYYRIVLGIIVLIYFIYLDK
jgi:undecaprenyl-diphosphatase